MSRRDLTSLLLQCLQKAFPDADYNKGSFVWTAVIDPIVEYAGSSPLELPARDFIKSVIRSKFPTQEVDKDSVLDDLFIKPAEAILAPFAREIRQIRQRQTVADTRIHTMESISSIAANFGIVPRSGDYARGSVRVYFAAPVNERVVPESYCETGSGLRFFAAGTQTITASQMTLNMEGDLYYWDVRVIAEKPGSAYNVAAGAIRRFPSLRRAVRVTNLYKFSGGLAQDTVEDIAAEIYNYPTTRSIGTFRGTKATISSLLGGVRRVELVGMGDPEMMRDIIRGGEISSEIAVYPSGALAGEQVSGCYGIGIPDGSASFYTTWFEDTLTPADFTSIFGTSSGPVSGYYLIVGIEDLSLKRVHWYTSRIVRVLTSRRIEVEDRVIPALESRKAYWAVAPARLTLSEVPGGILAPDTADGEVIIRDNEVHVGGCTDVFLLGASQESTSTDIKVVSDETLPGFGSAARTTAGSYDVYLTDAEEIVTLGPDSMSRVGPPPSQVYAFDTITWSGSIMDDVQAGQVLVAPSLGAAKQRYRIVSLLRQPGSAGRVWVYLDDNVLDGGGASPMTLSGAYIIKRSMGLKPGACLQLLSGSDAGYYKVLQEFEGSSSDSWPGCLFRVRVSTALTTTATGIAWRVADTIDINLSSPKELKVSGTDLLTFPGTDVVTSTSTDFKVYGVKAGDILRIDGGIDAGDHVIREEPFGPGNRSLRLSGTVLGSATVSYSVFAATTPISPPLVAVTKVSLLDADGGALGIDVPYSRALGAYSTQFVNMQNGVKLSDLEASAGIRTTEGIPLDGSGTYVFDPSATPFFLCVWHRQLGYVPEIPIPWGMPLAEGGFIAPSIYMYGDAGSYDLTTSSGWDSLVAYLNGRNTAGPATVLAPYRHWGWEERDGLAYLVCYGYGASLMLVGFTKFGFGCLHFGDPPFGDPITFSELGPAPSALSAYIHHHTSKDVYLSKPYDSAVPPIGLLQDVVDIPTGPNANIKHLLYLAGATQKKRLRLWGRHVYTPEMPAQVRVGFPSNGLAKTYFKDPTDFTVDGSTRYETENGITFWPDPTLFATVYPAYPETDPADDGYVPGAAPIPGTSVFSTDTGTNFWEKGVLPGDGLKITLRDIIFDQTAWPYNLAADETLTIREDGSAVTITVTFPAGTYADPGSTPPTGQYNAVSVINNAFGQEIALADGSSHVRLRWKKKIHIGGTAIAGMLNGVIPTATTTNEAYSYSSFHYPIIANSGTQLVVLGTLDTDDQTGCHMQYQIVRAGTQRFSAQQMAETKGPSGFYAPEVQLISWGVGDTFNIPDSTRLEVSDYRARGYSLSCENQELSYSTSEVPWLRIDPFFQEATVADEPMYDQGVLGAGLRIYYDRSPLVASAQALLNSREERDNNQSVLARHLFPHYVSFHVSYAGGALESVALPELQELITGRNPNEPLDVSDVIGVLTQLNANHVDTPIDLYVLRHNEDRSQSLLVGKDRVETTRLAGFLVGNISLSRRA